MRVVQIDRRTVWALSALAAASFVAAAMMGATGCGATTFHEEGPGQPDEKAYGQVPTGMVGVCRRPFSLEPELINHVLWDHAKECKPDTPKEYLRIGYGNRNNKPAEARDKHARMMRALREGEEGENPRTGTGGNPTLLTMLRTIRNEGLDDPWLKDRISRESARPEACDFSYLLDVMGDQSLLLREGGDQCAVYAYDQEDRQEVCLFDTSVTEAVWFTSAWACMTRTGTFGKGESCHRLCAFDDYCARQVSCAQPDIDLALCALGVCTPEPEVMQD